jgi:hypothetical protein
MTQVIRDDFSKLEYEGWEHVAANMNKHGQT